MADAVLVLGGTAEAVEFCHLYGKSHSPRLIYSTLRKPRNKPLSADCIHGSLGGSSGICELVRAQNVRCIVDLTHPFAYTISRHAREAAARCGVVYCAYHRPAWEPVAGDSWRSFADLRSLFAALPDASRAFISLGRSISQYMDCHRPGQFWLVALLPGTALTPPHPRIQVCHLSLPLDPRALKKLFQSQQIGLLICKNSGGAAGYAKITLARTLNIPVWMLERRPQPDDDRFKRYQALRSLCEAVDCAVRGSESPPCSTVARSR